MFHYTEEQIESPILDMRYHLAPWDKASFPGNTAVIASIRLGEDHHAAAQTFASFRAWCLSNDVKLVCCRLPQQQLVECGFLEMLGFRFIELNYKPTLDKLDRFTDDPEMQIIPALPSDAAVFSEYSAQIFRTGRYHADPQIGPEIGDRRYASWVAQAFSDPNQHIVKSVIDNQDIAYLIYERPNPTTDVWWLTGVNPNHKVRGLGRRTAQAILAQRHRAGVTKITTSVSTLNVASINYLMFLGFYFPPPLITLHWCPFGSVRGAG